ncbi:hypothetical protein Tco_1364829 [Tanacetum coccineum]
MLPSESSLSVLRGRSCRSSITFSAVPMPIPRCILGHYGCISYYMLQRTSEDAQEVISGASGVIVDKYISGLPDNIYGNVKSARPKTLDETIELANDLMDQKLRTYAERQSDNKKRADDSSRNNHGHQQQPFKRQNVAKVYNMGTGEMKPYGGSLPKCNKCHLHHNGPCTQR